MTTLRSWRTSPIIESTGSRRRWARPTPPSSTGLKWELGWGILHTQEPKMTWEGQAPMWGWVSQGPPSALYKVSHYPMHMGIWTSTSTTSHIGGKRHSSYIWRSIGEINMLHFTVDYVNTHFALFFFSYLPQVSGEAVMSTVLKDLQIFHMITLG